MSDAITMLVKSKLTDGKKDELLQVLADVSEHCRATEPGQLCWEWYLSNDEQYCYVIEKYENADAVLFHLANYQSFSERLGACRTIESMQVFGNINEQLQGLLTQINAEAHPHFFS